MKLGTYGRVGILLCALAASAAWAQDEPTAAQKQLRERYEKTLLDNPHPGIAFERLYQSYYDAEGVEAWLKELEEKSKADAASAAYPMLMGLVRERLEADDAALEAYAEAEKRDPKSWRAPAARGQLLWNLKRNEEAAAALRRAVELNPPRQQLQEMLKTLGRALAAAGKRDEATAAWMTLADRFPDDTATIEDLADLFVEEGQSEKAVEQYRKLREKAEDRYLKVRAALSEAELLAEQKKTDEAVALLRQLLGEVAPDTWLRVETRRVLEHTLRERSGGESVVTFYETWLTEHADDVEVRVALAELQRRMGKANEAEKVYRKVIEVAPSRKDARANLAELYLEQAKYAEAAKVYQELCELSPEDAKLWERLGQIYLSDTGAEESAQRKSAEAAWRNIFSRRPKDASRAVLAAEVMRAAKMSDAAVEHYRKAVELAPQETAHYEYIAEYLHELDRDKEAEAELAKMVAGDRATLANFTRQAEVLTRFGFEAQSLAAIESAMKLAATSADKFRLESMRAAILINKKKYDEAAKAIERIDALALTREQKHDARMARVELYQQSGRLAEEIAALEKKTPDAGTLELLALLQRAASKRLEAAQTIERVLQLAGDDPARMTTAVQMLREAGNQARAVELLKKLIQLEPQHETTHVEQIAELSRDMGDWQGAAAAAKRLIELTPDSDKGYLLAADLYGRSGKSKEGIEVLQQGVRRNPKELSLLSALAQRLADAGQGRAAIDRYWRAYDNAPEEADKQRIARDLAKVHVASGQFQRLVDRFEQLMLDPEAGDVAITALAAAYEEAAQPDKAQQVLERALRSKPSDTAILEKLFSLSGEQGLGERSLEYGRRLLALKPDDATLLMKMGSLLHESGREEEAMTHWRSAMRSRSGKDDAGANAMQMANTLLDHGMEVEAMEVLQSAAARTPDDWELAYTMAVYTKRAGQLDRAAAMFEAFLDRPAEKETHAHSASRYPSYVTYGQGPWRIRQWTNLPTVGAYLNQEFQSASYSRGRGVSLFSRSLGGGGYSYDPPDLESARLAALLQRVHIAESQGKLTPYLVKLADDAGYRYKVRSELEAAQGAAPAAGGGSKKGRERLLRTLVAIGLRGEAAAAAYEFHKAEPDNDDLLALLASQAVNLSTDDGEALGGEEWPPLPIRDEAPTAEALFDKLAAKDRESAVVIAPSLIRSLMQKDKKDEALARIEWMMKQGADFSTRLTAIQFLLESDKKEGVKQLVRDNFPALHEHAQKTVPPLQSQQHYLLIYRFGQMAVQLVEKDELELAVEVFREYVVVAAQSQPLNALFGRGRTHDVLFSLAADPEDEESGFPNVNPLLEQSVRYVLAELNQSVDGKDLREKASPLIEKAMSEFSDPKAQLFALGVLLDVDGREKKLDRAVERLTSHVKATGDDKARLLLAHVLVMQKKHAEAIEQLRLVKTTVGDPAKQSQMGLLLLGELTKQPEVSKDAAQKLARMSLLAEEGMELATRMTGMGMEDQAKVLTQRYASSLGGGASQGRVVSYLGGMQVGSAQAGQSKRVVQLQRFAREKNLEGGTRLAERILADKAGTLGSQRNVDMEVTTAIAYLKRADRLDGYVQSLKTKTENDPKAVEPLAQLHLIYSTTGKPKEAKETLDKIFAASPSNVDLRLQYAMSFANTGDYAAAAPHYEYVLKNSPQSIREGWYVYYAFRESGRVKEMVELLEAIKTAPSVSLISLQGGDFSWIEQVAAQMEQEESKLAVRVYEKQRELGGGRGESHLRTTSAIIRLAAREGDTERVRREFKSLLPDSLPAPTRTAKGYRQASARMFKPDYTSNRQTIGEVRPVASPVDQIIETFVKAGVLAELEQMVASAGKDEPWMAAIGRPVLALAALRHTPADTKPAETLAEELAKAASGGDSQAKYWACAVAQCFTELLAKDDATLVLAGKFANVGRKHQSPNDQDMRADIVFRMVGARALQAEGKTAEAREMFIQALKVENPQMRYYRGQTIRRGMGWLFTEEFGQKSPFFDAVLKAGHADLLADTLLAYDEKLSEGNDWETRSFTTATGPLLRNAKLKAELVARAEKAEALLQEKPKDAKLLNQAIRLHRLAGQTAKVKELAARLETAETPATLSAPEQKLKSARELMKAGKKAEARKLVLTLVAEGHVEQLENIHEFRPVMTGADAAADVAAAFEQLAQPTNAVAISRTLRQGDWWISNLLHSMDDGQQRDDAARQKFHAAMSAAFVAGEKVLQRTIASRGGGNERRPLLGQLVFHLASAEKHADAYEYLRKSIFDAAAMQLAEPSPAELFAQTWSILPEPKQPTPTPPKPGEKPVLSPRPPQRDMECLATALVELAVKAGRVAELSEAIAARSKEDAAWAPIGARLEVLIALREGKLEGLAEKIAKLADDPIIGSGLSTDPSTGFIAERALKHEALKAASLKTIEDAFQAAATEANRGEFADRQGPALLRRYVVAGGSQKFPPMLQTLWQSTARSGYPADWQGRYALGSCRLAASILAEAGQLELAADYLRVLERYPGDHAQEFSNYSGHPEDYGRLESLLDKLKTDGKLEAYTQRVRGQMPMLAKGREKGRSAEPLTTLAACFIRLEKYDEALAALDEITPDDIPAGLMMLVRSVEKLDAASPHAPKLVERIDRLFVRAPLLWEPRFGSENETFVRMHEKFKVPLPIGEPLAAMLREWRKRERPQSRRPNASPSLMAFDGTPDLPGAEDANTAMGAGVQTLQQLAAALDAGKHPDAALALNRALFENLADTKAGVRWLAALRKNDPNLAYATALRVVGLGEPLSADEKENLAKVTPLDLLFAQAYSDKRDSKTIGFGGASFATHIVELAKQTDRLKELIESLEKILADTQPHPRLAHPVAQRLHLMALAAYDTPRFVEILPKYLQHEDPFAEEVTADPDNNDGQSMTDPTMMPLAELCWALEPLRQYVPQILQAAMKASEQFVEQAAGAQSQFGDIVFVDTRLWLQMAHVQFEMKNPDAAFAAAEDLLKRHVAKTRDSGGRGYRSDLYSDVFRLADLAIAYKVQPRMLELFKAQEKEAADAEAARTPLVEAIKRLETLNPKPPEGAKPNEQPGKPQE